MKVVVAGGGISGLALGWRLMNLGHEVHVFEASDRIGGAIRTQQVGPYLFEEGAVAVESPAPAFTRLVDELGLEDRLLTSEAQHDVRWLYHHGQLHAMPRSFWDFLTTPLFRPREKLRALAEPFLPATRVRHDCSVAEFFGRRIGRAVTSTWVDVITSHLFAGHPNRLGIRGSFPKFFDAVQKEGGVLRAFVREQGEAAAGGNGSCHSFVGGLSVLTDTLAAGLGHALALNTRVQRFTRGDPGTIDVTVDGADGQEVVRCDRLVLATPVRATGMLLAPVSPTAADLLFEIESASLVTAFLAARSRELPGIPSGRDFHAARCTRMRTLGWTFTSNLFPSHAGEDRAVINGMIGGMLDKPIIGLTDDVIRHLLLGELALCLGQRRMPEPDHMLLSRWPGSIPQYQVGHPKRLDAVMQLAAMDWPEVHLVGNYVQGSLIEDCLQRVDEVVATLARPAEAAA